MLEAGLWLQKAGCKGVGVSTGDLNARWRTMWKELEQQRSSLEKRWKLRRRWARKTLDVLLLHLSWVNLEGLPTFKQVSSRL